MGARVSPRPNGATAARWIPDPKAGGSNPSSVTHPGVAQLVEQWTVKRVAQRSIGRQFKSASPDSVFFVVEIFEMFSFCVL